jgi:hypothetical protein
MTILAFPGIQQASMFIINWCTTLDPGYTVDTMCRVVGFLPVARVAPLVAATGMRACVQAAARAGAAAEAPARLPSAPVAATGLRAATCAARAPPAATCSPITRTDQNTVSAPLQAALSQVDVT